MANRRIIGDGSAHGTDIAAVTAAAGGAVLAMFIAEGVYTWLSTIVSITLLLVLAGFVFGRAQSIMGHLAVGAASSLTALPIEAFVAQNFHFSMGIADLIAPVVWLIGAVLFTVLNFYLAHKRIVPAAENSSRREASRPIAKVVNAEDELPGDRLYRTWKPLAHWLRTALQMLTGVTVTCLLLAKAALSMTGIEQPQLLWLQNTSALEVVGTGLGFAAGFELAYMLFTPGPDEAVEPLVLGFAAGALLMVSRAESLSNAAGAVLLVVGIGLLFIIHRKFLPQK